jgi:transcriptional regulator with XRE-family HTH domain
MKSIRDYLDTTGMTQQALAKAAKVNPMALNHWLHRRRTPSLANLKRLSEATGMTLERLTKGMQ